MPEALTAKAPEQKVVTKVNDCADVYPAIPFENIALTFSGGGFRAASFSLGVLSYLDHCYLKDENDRLINHVKYITSTSGGSITNGLYSTSAYSNQEFEFTKFYNELRSAMDGEKLLGAVFEILEDDAQWTEQGTLIEHGETRVIRKPRNLINAFAKAYDKLLFHGKTLDCIYSCPHNPSLEEVCFNATEFNNGLSFYFQANSQSSQVQKVGNEYLTIADIEVIKNLKISDIVAASSCFPGGFEPILYPNDFVHDGLKDINKMYSAVNYQHNDPTELGKIINKPFALMDGGIADNMGIVNVMSEDQSRLDAPDERRFDLILACDVTSYFNEPIPEPDAAKNRGISIQFLINIFKFSPIVLVISSLMIILQIFPIVGYLFIIPSSLFTAVFIFFRRKLTNLEKTDNGKVTMMLLSYLDYFLRLPKGVLLPMITARARSGIKLISDIFLKQIRLSQYENLFTKPRMVHRTISCLIFEFSSQHQDKRVEILNKKDAEWWKPLSDILMPSEELQAVANDAKSVGTTLWFDKTDMKNHKRDKVIATGQFTACYNLIKHICRLETMKQEYKNDETLQQLKQRLLSDWKLFKADPMFMVER